MIETTPDERLALVVIALLIGGGTTARYAVSLSGRGAALEFSQEAADTLVQGSAQSLRGQVAAEVAEARARNIPLAAGETVDPNSATSQELDRIPGIGPSIAEAIVTYRDRSGPFGRPEDLLDVPGFGQKALERTLPFLNMAVRRDQARVREAGIDLNRASAAELESIRGVGPALAERIVEYRREHGRFQSWEELEEVSGIGPAIRERIEAGSELRP